MTEANPLEEFVLRYKDDPVLFVKEVLGATPYDYQAEFLWMRWPTVSAR